MARITVEDCLAKENNRFVLVHLAAKRTKQILQGSRVLSEAAQGNKTVVAALREIAEGKVRFMTEEEAQEARDQERQRALQAQALGASDVDTGNGSSASESEAEQEDAKAEPPADEGGD